MCTLRAVSEGLPSVKRLRHRSPLAPVRRTMPGIRYAFDGDSDGVTTIGAVDFASITVAKGYTAVPCRILQLHGVELVRPRVAGRLQGPVDLEGLIRLHVHVHRRERRR